jgi:hypothetical protein
MSVLVKPNQTAVIVQPLNRAAVVVGRTPTTVVVPQGRGSQGERGPTGPQGESGTMVVTLPYDEWPPVDPQPNTLYLRLAP